MTMDEIIAYVSGLDDGVLVLRPRPGDGTPEIAWGDAFFYHSPDGSVPTAVQPFATIVTKDYPDDLSSRLDRPDTFRLNVHVSKDDFARLTGHRPREAGAAGADPSAPDTVFPHPLYGTMGWLSIVNPGPRTGDLARELLRKAHETARSRYERRA
ncbi:DUF6194 family protein [Catenuloplanes atrovinosus]|uniref:DUF6194 domain-containing protein n=1 Tax=Catenuloplanes atrovinosus TaxID=137266 RepID=A0AAE3YK23_9ACTN|nr:DUF6194 family protein [Catenuloplanes atrovinosus]MDR7275273.1 hypothetical protein [Catenuloplanes atrovinosus]